MFGFCLLLCSYIVTIVSCDSWDVTSWYGAARLGELSGWPCKTGYGRGGAHPARERVAGMHAWWCYGYSFYLAVARCDGVYVRWTEIPHRPSPQARIQHPDDRTIIARRRACSIKTMFVCLLTMASRSVSGEGQTPPGRALGRIRPDCRCPSPHPCYFPGGTMCGVYALLCPLSSMSSHKWDLGGKLVASETGCSVGSGLEGALFRSCY